MCYYNGIKVTHGEFLRLKHLEKAVAELIIPVMEGPLYLPGATYPVLKPVAGREDFEVVDMEWGFLPPENEWPFLKSRLEVERWRKGFTDMGGQWHSGYTTLNAMSENLLVNEKGKPSLFRNAAMERRVLIPSTGFFEWQHLPQIGKKGKPLKAMAKYPYYIYLPEFREAGKPFYMAGIYNPWTDAGTGERVETFTITTARANGLMEQVHNVKKRMPTILNEDLAYEWMFGKLSKERILEIAATQYPADKMWAHPIAKDFKNALDPTAEFDYGGLVPPLTQVAA